MLSSLLLYLISGTTTICNILQLIFYRFHSRLSSFSFGATLSNGNVRLPYSKSWGNAISSYTGTRQSASIDIVETTITILRIDRA